MKSLVPWVKNKRGRICKASPTDRSIFPSTYCEFFKNHFSFEVLYSLVGEVMLLCWFSCFLKSFMFSLEESNFSVGSVAF